MKLINKKTGEIGELHFEPDKKYHFTVVTEDPADLMIFKTLGELNEEWEDYKEPKEYWFVSATGMVHRFEGKDKTYTPSRKQLGNYFSSREEAEKAVEKIKAWKRLKDKGFKFIEGYLDNNDDFIIKAKLGHVGLIDQPDVSLLFGGEE